MTKEDEIEIFLSDRICEQVVSINYRNGQIFCTIKDRITSKKKEITLSAAIIDEMYPGVLEISPNTHISDVKAAGKIYHASQLGIFPEDYGMNPEDVKRINQIGIYNYAREGRPLPPIELINDYEMAMKDICTNGKVLEGTYSSKAEQKIHEAIYNYNMETRKVVGFYKETGELITSTKYKEATFQNFLITKNLGTLN